MAEGDITIYNKFKEDVLAGLHDLSSGGDTIKISLHTGYTPDIDAHTVWADVSATEYAVIDGYARGTLAGQDLTLNEADDCVYLEATSYTFASLGPLSPAIPSHAILWNDSHADDALILVIELGSTATTGANYTIQWPLTPASIFSLT